MLQKYLRRFKTDVSGFEKPNRFNNPFHYEPHPLCKIAAKELQNELNTTPLKGKMYGVLVVESPNKSLNYLIAVSGNQPKNNSAILFVPPVFDVTNPSGFFVKGEQELNQLSRSIEQLEHADALKKLYQEVRVLKEKSVLELYELKQSLKAAKQKRDIQREEIINDNSINNKDVLLEALIKESKTLKSKFSTRKKHWKSLMEAAQASLQNYLLKIEALKEERREKSALLQAQLFKQYRFYNAKADAQDLLEIFARYDQKVPPAAAGECAAPKLLQYAFANKLKPIAMAEFWWGPSPKTEVRKHGYFYAACQSKCKPILGFMLQGLNVEFKKIGARNLKISVLFEDTYLAVILKPAGLLSVPGKEEDESVFSQAKQLYPQASGPLIVHRLDMATSGLLLIAKSKAVHAKLQQQFLNRTIQKRYVALLNGEIDENEGFIELPLRVDLNDRPRQLVCYEHGKVAKTKFKVIEKTNGKTRIHFFPITGRTHQLRVHAAHQLGLNTPMVGDALYGKKADRLYLHAEGLSFVHPETEKKMTFTKKAEF